MNSSINPYSPLIAGRRRFETHKNLPSNLMRHSSVDNSKTSETANSTNRIAGIATSYDQGDFDSIFLNKGRPEYKSTNANYGTTMPQFYAYEHTFNDIQSLRDSLIQKNQLLSRKGSESDMSIAEAIYAPEYAVGSKDPHSASKYNPTLREQAHARRLEDLRRLRTEEFNSQLRSSQKKQEYKEYLDMQQKLRDGSVSLDSPVAAYSSQKRHTRKSPKTTSFNPLVGEVNDYSEYLFKEDQKPKYNSPPVVPGSYKSPIVTQFPSDMTGAVNAFFAIEDSKPSEVKAEVPRKKLAGYGQLVMNAPPQEPAFTRQSGLGYRPTSYLIR